MRPRRRNVIKNNFPLNSGKTRSKRSIDEIEINTITQFHDEVCDRLSVKNGTVEDFQSCSGDHQMSNVVILNKQAVPNNHLNNNYIESNNCRRNSDRLRKNKSDIHISVPKKQNIRWNESSVQLNKYTNKVNSTSQSNEANQNGKKVKNGEKMPAKPKRSKRLTNKNNAERQVQSDTMNKNSGVAIDHYDGDEEEEEDERLEIEHKLMALNKDSGITDFNDFPDFEERLKEDEPIQSTDKQTLLNGSTGPKPIIVTQKPDGQLHGCPKCPEVFLSELELFRHKREHKTPKIVMDNSKVKQYYDLPDRSKCPVCKKLLPFTERTFWIKHLQSHNAVGEFVCSVCKRVFKRKDHMRMHQKRHIV